MQHFYFINDFLRLCLVNALRFTIYVLSESTSDFYQLNSRDRWKCSSHRAPVPVSLFCGIIVICITYNDDANLIIHCNTCCFTICYYFLSPLQLCSHPPPLYSYWQYITYIYLIGPTFHHIHIILYSCFLNQLVEGRGRNIHLPCHLSSQNYLYQCCFFACIWILSPA